MYILVFRSDREMHTVALYINPECFMHFYEPANLDL